MIVVRLLVLVLLLPLFWGEVAWSMTVRAKAGQVLALAFRGPVLDGPTLDRLKSIQPGGVILYRWNVENPSQVKELISDLRKRCPLDEPIMVALDQEGGLVARIRTDDSDFPGLMALGATGDISLARRQGYVIGTQMKSLGVDVDYAPVVDVNSNPYNPVIGVRSFGDNVDLVSSMGVAMIEGFMESGLGCSAKHFPGHGDVDMDSHLDLPVLDRSLDSLRALELVPFKAAIEAGVPAIMTAHVVVPELTGDLPATLSPAMVSLLREEMGFDGVILSDSMGMKAISDRWGVPEATVMALKAGVDMILLGADPAFPPERHGEVHDRIVQAVASGELDEAVLDRAIDRIVKWKNSIGLYGESGRPLWIDGSDLMREIAVNSVTLIKSDGSLPIGDSSVLLLWPEVSIAKGEILASFLRESGVKVSLQPFDENGHEDLVEKGASFDRVLVGTYDILKYRSAVPLLASLGDKVVLLSMKTPYDVVAYPDAGTVIACYGDRPETLRALSSGLTKGEFFGKLPVEIPGLFPFGSKLDGF
ncbi:beta-N-acetylhexosaminidase [Dethiosulfovibrio salsuginis]|uniref:Beta-N-acetylhexosaminidase n=1 Tax=Dethiosulfovibrio salsuginis TaxID=561720 RepID=A0A1X7IJC3_9BACT|nr:beta-N-acetylhexosaminidase [Dethiosulfovibrio salsuginis]SMG15004.1 beta-N-acetylhexosaminidase [Dethiosulfovibrio salsuginis]